jgi:hypothetical protein
MRWNDFCARVLQVGKAHLGTTLQFAIQTQAAGFIYRGKCRHVDHPPLLAELKRYPTGTHVMVQMEKVKPPRCKWSYWQLNSEEIEMSKFDGYGNNIENIVRATSNNGRTRLHFFLKDKTSECRLFPFINGDKSCLGCHIHGKHYADDKYHRCFGDDCNRCLSGDPVSYFYGMGALIDGTVWIVEFPQHIILRLAKVIGDNVERFYTTFPMFSITKVAGHDWSIELDLDNLATPEELSVINKANLSVEAYQKLIERFN